MNFIQGNLRISFFICQHVFKTGTLQEIVNEGMTSDTVIRLLPDQVQGFSF